MICAAQFIPKSVFHHECTCPLKNPPLYILLTFGRQQFIIEYMLNFLQNGRLFMDKGDERKKQLLRVALDIFIEKGYYGTSTREIAR